MSDDRDGSGAAGFAFAGAVFLMAAHVAGKATRDALFLSIFPATDLPVVMIVAAIVSLGFTVGVSRLLARRPPRAVMPAALVASAVLFAAEWALVQVARGPAAWLVYVHFAALGAVLISGFWSVVNERFDPHSGKSTMARIGGFATLGGVLGGAGAGQAAAYFELATMLWGLAALHLGCALAVWGMARGTPAARDKPEAAPDSGLSILRRSSFLKQMAALALALAVADALLDYALKSEAAAFYSDSESLIRFFALFYTVTGLLAFVLQWSIGARALRRLGLGGSMALLPIAVIAASALGTAVTRLLTVSLARGAAFGLASSTYRAGFELLYTPLPTAVKRPTKTYIDVGAVRLGDMLGALAILACLALAPAAPTSTWLFLTIGVSLLALLLIMQLQRSYVNQLADSLRSGSITLDDEDVLDATTAHTIADTQALDRAEVLARIRDVQRSRAAPSVETALAQAPPDRVRRELAARPREPALVPQVLGLLERYDVREDAVAYLVDVAPRAAGQLGDALADAEQPLLVRRYLPRVLETLGTARALDDLVRGLDDADFDVRLQCARAAARLIASHPELQRPLEDLTPVLERELAAPERAWEQHGRRRDEPTAQIVLAEGPLASVVNRSVEYVFAVLSLSLGHELISSAVRGLYAGDANLRGTALEYLETALPESLHHHLIPRLPQSGGQRRGRSAAEAAEELLRNAPKLTSLGD